MFYGQAIISDGIPEKQQAPVQQKKTCKQRA